MGNSQSHSQSGEGRTGGRVSGLRSRSSTVNSIANRVVSSHKSASASTSTQPDEPTIDLKKQVDGGWLTPQTNLYARIDYSRPTVHRLIVEKRLAPFYLGLQDFEEEWEVEAIVEALDEAELQATQNLKDAHAAAVEAANEAEAAQLSAPTGTRKHKDAVGAFNMAVLHRERLAEMVKQRDKRGGGALQTTDKAQHAALYQQNAVECPICFLYYPSNMVHTRCCDQPICTECFIQIKRAEPTPTHLESEPAACPFCMEANFGCVYEKPRGGRPSIEQTASDASGSSTGSNSSPTSPTSPTSERRSRRKSFAHTEKEVVTTDMIHPDWEAKLEQMKALVARRANRRIVFRQVGDRLVPVGITSGRGDEGATPTMATTSLPPGLLSQIAAALDASNENGGGSRRRSRGSRRRSNDEMAQLLESLGLGGGADIEELMLQEAMRQSQLEEEERQKKAQTQDSSAAGESVAPAAQAPPATSNFRVDENPATERMLSEAMSGSVSPALSAPASPPRLSLAPTTTMPAYLASTSPTGPQPISEAGLDLPSTPTEPQPAVPEVLVAKPTQPARPDPPLPAASFASETSNISAHSASSSQGYLPLSEDAGNPYIEQQQQQQQQQQRKHTAGEHIEVGSQQPLIQL